MTKYKPLIRLVILSGKPDSHSKQAFI